VPEDVRDHSRALLCHSRVPLMALLLTCFLGCLLLFTRFEDLVARGGLDADDCLDLQRAVAAASAWGWRLATRRHAAAAAAARAAGEPHPGWAAPGVAGERPAHVSLAEQVLRSEAFPVRVLELLLGAAAAAATQRERYADGAAPGPLEAPVGFGLPWAGGGTSRSEA